MLRVAAVLAWVLTGTLLSVAGRSEDAVTPPPVTARPPREAVPAPPVTTALQRRIRQCNLAAKTQHLHGTARQSYMRSCMGSQHAAQKTAAAGAAHGGSAKSAAPRSALDRSASSASAGSSGSETAPKR